MQENSVVALQCGSLYLFGHSDTLNADALNHITQDFCAVQHLGHSISVGSHTADLWTQTQTYLESTSIECNCKNPIHLLHLGIGSE